MAEDSTWTIGDSPIEADKKYKIAMPTYLLNVGDTNLEFLVGLEHEAPDSIGKSSDVKNDVRDLVIAWFKSGGAY